MKKVILSIALAASGIFTSTSVQAANTLTITNEKPIIEVTLDDDGFVDSPRTIMRMTSCKQEQLDELEGKSFIITFPSGVLVQRHWKQNNQIRPDRYTKTAYQEELSRLTVDKNGCYLVVEEGIQPNANQTDTTCQPSDNQTEPQYSLGKFSLEKVKTGEGRGEKGRKGKVWKIIGEGTNA